MPHFLESSVIHSLCLPVFMYTIQKTTMLYGTICETESKGYRKEAERKKHSLELRMPCDKSVYKEQASASAEPI